MTPGFHRLTCRCTLQHNGMSGKWRITQRELIAPHGAVGKLEPLVAEPALSCTGNDWPREKILIVLASICGAVSKGLLLNELVPPVTSRVFSEKISVIGAFSLRKSHPIYDFAVFPVGLLLTDASSYLIFIFIVCIFYQCLDYHCHWFLTGNGKKLQLKC